MLLKGFFNTDSFNPQPYWDNTIVNLSGAQKFEEDTVFKPGRYRIEVAPGKSVPSDPTLDSLAFGDDRTGLSNMDYEETIEQPFIIRAYCGGDGTRTSVGINQYSGGFKVNGQTSSVNQQGIDVNHIFGAGGGNGYGRDLYLFNTYLTGGGNCLGNGTRTPLLCNDYSTVTYGGAGSCLHLLPVGGVFGADYIRAYHTCGLSTCPGSAYGGAAGAYYKQSPLSGDFATRGGNSPYGNGGAVYTASGSSPMPSVGTGPGAGGKTAVFYNSSLGTTYTALVGAGAYFNGTIWVDCPGNNTNKGHSYIRVTYLGPLT